MKRFFCPLCKKVRRKRRPWATPEPVTTISAINAETKNKFELRVEHCFRHSDPKGRAA